MNNERSTVVNGFMWKFLERISSQGVSFILSIVLARLLLPEEYGTVAMLNIFIVIANVFITAGFASALIQKKDADDIDFSTMLWCSMAMSVVLYLIIYGTAPIISSFYNMPELTPITRVYALSLIISGYNSIQTAWVSRHMVFKKFFYATLSGTFIAGLIGVILAYYGFGVWALVAQSLGNIAINTIVMRSIITWKPSFVFSIDRAKSLSNYGYKLLLTNLIGTICDELHQLLIGKFYTPSDLAFFNRGKHFPQLFNNNIDSTINTVLFPAMSNHSDRPDIVKSLTRKAIKTSSFLMFFFMGTLFVIAHPLIEILLTEKWLPSVPFMQLLCISGMLSTVSTANLQAIKAIGRSDIMLKLEFFKKPIFFILVFVSVNISVYALVVSMPIYSIIAGFVNMYPNKKLLGYSIKEQLKDYMPATLLCVLMILLAYPLCLLHINSYLLLATQCIVCLSVYLGASVLFKVDTLNFVLRIINDKIKK